MTLSCCFRLSLNKITVTGSLKSKIYNLFGHLHFNLVVLEETNYINFQLLNSVENNLKPELYDSIEDFVKLITTPEYVSLTFNTFYMDNANRKVIFKPRILPGFSYEFDFMDKNMDNLKKELTHLSDLLGGFITLKNLTLAANDYDFEHQNGNYQAALDYSSDLEN